MLGDPRVHQAIARAGIKTCDLAIRRKAGEVGNTADINDGAMAACIAKYGLVKRRRQRRTLAARSNIAAAKICHHGDTRQLCQ